MVAILITETYLNIYDIICKYRTILPILIANSPPHQVSMLGV